MSVDDAIGRARVSRKEISKRLNNDPGQLVHYYQKLQKKYAQKILSLEPNTAREDPPQYEPKL
jgi:hypothetical protein